MKRSGWADGIVLIVLLLTATLMARSFGAVTPEPTLTPTPTEPTPTEPTPTVTSDLQIDDVPQLDPALVPGLPEAVVSDLQRQKAKVVTRSLGDGPDVVKGRFFKPDQIDWVVRASLPSQQWAILVYPGGRGPAEMLQVAGPSVPHERSLEVVPPIDLPRCFEGAVYDGFKPRQFDHDGLGTEDNVALWSRERQTWLWTGERRR